jgi:hypothetical protein
MFEEADLDERERQIMESADSYWAMRFLGSGKWDRLGPFVSLEQVTLQVRDFFRREDKGDICPPPASITSRPFLIYASSSAQSDAQCVVGNMYRDGIARPTYVQFRRKRLEAKELEAKQKRSRDRSNAARGAKIPLR